MPLTPDHSPLTLSVAILAWGAEGLKGKLGLRRIDGGAMIGWPGAGKGLEVRGGEHDDTFSSVMPAGMKRASIQIHSDGSPRSRE